MIPRNEMTVEALWTPAGEIEVTGVGYAPQGVLFEHGLRIAEIKSVGKKE